MSEEISVRTVDGVAVITLDAPQRRNALTLDSSEALRAAITAIEQDENVHAIVLTGTSPAFCAGADLSALGAAKETGLRRIYAGFLALAQCSLPTVAAVGGAAVGAGLNLALAADVRLAGPRAKFVARFLELGIHPGGGMSWMLQRAVGQQQAVAMTLFGEVLGAEEAVAAGLTLRTVPGEHDDLVDAACTLAKPAADAPRELVRTTKRSMRTTVGLTEHSDAVDVEIGPQVASIDSPEFAERLAAMRARIGST